MPLQAARNNLVFLSCFTLFQFYALSLHAQYFGRNKVLYQNFDFSVIQTPHFNIYHYLNDVTSKQKIADWAERWYEIHHAILGDSLRKKNPLMIYDHHADFQQTRAISGEISVGTSGVTESLKNRVVLPFLESNAQTDHVLGHEIVHAFQYHLIKDSLNINAFKNLPLWMVEGMAEYMSTGYVDGHTAMWLRSAVLNHTLPTLKDLTTRPDLYFPYRWGEAFWAYVTGVYGDGVIKTLFLETGKKGYAAALKKILGVDEKTFSTRWHEAILHDYTPYLEKVKTPPGEKIISLKNAGKINIVPSVSGNGKYMAFWTEKDLFSLDLYLADVTTGKIIRKLNSNAFNSRVDQYNTFESSIAWSPDNKKIAFVAFAKGHNRLMVISVDGKSEELYDLPGLSGFSSPAWSPNGRTIVVTGIVEGKPDLFAFNIRSRSLKQLTNDEESQMLPSFSPDGNWILYATDHNAMQQQAIVHRYTHNIAMLNVQTGAIKQFDFFSGSNNMNPVFSPDGQSIYFLSDRDGFRNLYSYHLNDKTLYQHTELFTGISGITPFAPAISISSSTGTFVYTYYDDARYSIYMVNDTELPQTEVATYAVHQLASMLPPFERGNGNNTVQTLLDHQEQPDKNETADIPYSSKFGLDYVGSSGVGVETSNRFGNGITGGIGGVFSDMTGDHQLYAALSLNGQIFDVAGQFTYLNQKHRFNWGVSVSHIPYLSGAQYVSRDFMIGDDGDSINVINYTVDLLRTFEDQLSVFASYPFTSTKRIEAGASFARYYYRLDRYTEFYDERGITFLSDRKSKEPVPPGFNLAQADIAFVGDQSSFGVASPLAGHRFRFEAARYFGVVQMGSLLADYRKYFRFKPFSLATRNMFMGRYGNDASNGLLPPLYVGYSSLVRGYEALAYPGNSSGLKINDLIGSKIFISNIELRFPFSGPERLSAIKSRWFFTEFSLFTDGGIAWGKSVYLGSDIQRSNAKVIMSTGLSMRINLFGLMILEPFYSIPWQNGGWNRRSFGLNVLPGW